MIISPSKEFIFIHLEKCGGTSVETALEPHLAWYDMIIGGTNFGENLQSLYFNKFGIDQVKNNMLWKHSSAHTIYYFIGPEEWKNFKKFSVVRDPIELMKSYYDFSQTVVKYHMGRINRSLWKDKIYYDENYNSFPLSEKYVLAYIESHLEDSGINGFVEKFLSHVPSQFSRISINGDTNIGMVVDLSQLNNKWDDVVDYLGFEDEIPLSHLNASEKSKEELSPRAIKKIKRHFAIDYQMLSRYTGVYW